jgi:hypothetical protein
VSVHADGNSYRAAIDCRRVAAITEFPDSGRGPLDDSTDCRRPVLDANYCGFATAQALRRAIAEIGSAEAGPAFWRRAQLNQPVRARLAETRASAPATHESTQLARSLVSATVSCVEGWGGGWDSNPQQPESQNGPLSAIVFELSRGDDSKESR